MEIQFQRQVLLGYRYSLYVLPQNDSYFVLFEFACEIPGLGRSPGGGHSNLLQYSCLENYMDRGPWWAWSIG